VVVARYPRSETASWEVKPQAEASEKSRVEKTVNPVESKPVAVPMAAVKPVLTPSPNVPSSERADEIRHHRFLTTCERVYDAFLDEDTAKQFLFTSPGGEIVQAAIEPQVGGNFTFVERRNGADVMHIGEYLEMQRARRLVFSFVTPQFSSESTRVEIDFIWKGTEVCDVMLRHKEVPKAEAEQIGDEWKEVMKAAGEVLKANG